MGGNPSLRAALHAQDCYLEQVQAEADPGASEDVLELSNGVDHVLHTTLSTWYAETCLLGMLRKENFRLCLPPRQPNC